MSITTIIKISVFVFVSGLILSTISGCKRDPDMSNDVLLDGPIDPNIVEANTKFGFNLFNEILKTEDNSNIFISPFSISVAVAMTLNGAAGDTEEGMVNTLQLHNIDTEVINPGYAILQQTLQVADPKVTLTLANSLWGNQEFSFDSEYRQRNSQFFEAEITSLDFRDPSSVNSINHWVNDKTNGNIPEIIDEISSDDVLFLLNAVYFKGSWQTEFDPTNTRDAMFHLADGSNKPVPMMFREDKYPFFYSKEFQAVSLPYGDGRISMYIFLPSNDSDLNTFLESLNIENWEEWISQFSERKVGVNIPKFKLEYKIELNQILKNLGMETAFNHNQADFSRMVSTDTALTGNLYISKVDHKTFVEVNEEGTEAAAVTGIGISVTSLPPQFTVNRPFFFAIRDNETGTILFMGTVVDPLA
ncbi:proteinase inhibitor I4 serpin [Candidatus Poribacteria bacterium]|nr:MAG: proteinase inhibitor I4 serpin [Candidatus Poribacteria bacterium]